MPITVQYETLFKRAAGTGSEVIDLDGPQDVRNVIRQVAEKHGNPLHAQLVDVDGGLRPSVLVFVGDHQVSLIDGHPISDGDVVTLMSPISGG